MFGLRVLGGPMVLESDGRPVRLRPMERVVMLALLCAKGHRQTAVKLAGQLYADRPQYSAVRTLTSHVAHIRDGLRAVAGDDRLLVSDRMIGGGVTYGLDVVAAHVDALQFEQRAAAGRRLFEQGLTEPAIAGLADALELWQGSPLSDAADWPFARAEISRLENLHRAAIITWAEALAAARRHDETIGELTAMAAARPVDSTIWELLATSLCRCNREAEAAAVCAEAIAALWQRGLNTDRLTKLQEDVLNGSLPRLDARLREHTQFGVPHLTGGDSAVRGLEGVGDERGGVGRARLQDIRGGEVAVGAIDQRQVAVTDPLAIDDPQRIPGLAAGLQGDGGVVGRGRRHSHAQTRLGAPRAVVELVGHVVSVVLVEPRRDQAGRFQVGDRGYLIGDPVLGGVAIAGSG
jgi:DNA-binding SARP family transcriptional activator